MKQVAWVLGVAQQKHHKNHLKTCKHREIRYHFEILMENLNNKQFNK
jgi:hypothetical protein